MPFTLSHAVLAPPLARLSRHLLPIAAIAIGCMLPDLYRLFSSREDGFSHSWPALWHPNLAIGLGFCGLWYGVYRPVLYQLFDLEDAIAIFDVWSALKFVLGCVLALMLGNALHIVWDGLTHVDARTFILHEQLLQRITLLGYSLPVHFILQIASSIITLPILLWMLRRYQQRYRGVYSHHIGLKISIVLIFVLAVVVGLGYATTNLAYLLQAPDYHLAYYFIGRAFNTFSQGFLLSSSLGCVLLLIWQQIFSSD